MPGGKRHLGGISQQVSEGARLLRAFSGQHCVQIIGQTLPSVACESVTGQSLPLPCLQTLTSSLAPTVKLVHPFES